MNQYYKMMLLSGGETSDGNAPVNTVAPAISGTLVVGNVLSCSTGTWTSDTGIIPPYTYQWYRGVSAISGETNNTYTLVQADAGQNIKCRVTACDSDGCTNADSNSVYIIDAEAQAHYDRVIADGGTIPLGLNALNSFVVSVKSTYGVASVNTALWACKPHWGISGIKTASGTGATAGGRATSVLYDICGVNGDFIQTTASAQPLALVHSGTNYAYCPGVTGNGFLTSLTNYVFPTSSGLRIDACVYLQTASARVIAAKDSGSGSGRCFDFGWNGSAFRFNFGNGFSYTATCTVATTVGFNGWARVTAEAVGGDMEVKFYTSSDDITYTQLGTTVTVVGAGNSIQLGSTGYQIGGNATTLNNTWAGEIHRIRIYDASNNLVHDFNPSSYNRATSQTSWVSSTGETWTLNTASTNNALKATIVDQTMIMGNGTSYGMRAPNLNINDTAITSYTVFRKFVNTLGGQIISELGENINTGQGKLHTINEGANDERISIRANTGINASSFTSTSLSLKVAIGINNISNANEALPYLINNVSQSFLLQPSSSNNTTAMNATGYNLLARNNSASAWANVIATGDIVAKGENDNAQRTAMYNLLKTLNNI